MRQKKKASKMEAYEFSKLRYDIRNLIQVFQCRLIIGIEWSVLT